MAPTRTPAVTSCAISRPSAMGVAAHVRVELRNDGRQRDGNRQRQRETHARRHAGIADAPAAA